MSNKILIELNIHNGHIATCNCCKNLNRFVDYYGGDESEDNVAYSCKVNGLLDDFICRIEHEGYDMMLCGVTCDKMKLEDD